MTADGLPGRTSFSRDAKALRSGARTSRPSGPVLVLRSEYVASRPSELYPWNFVLGRAASRVASICMMS